MKGKILIVLGAAFLCMSGIVQAQDDVVQISDTQVWEEPDQIISDGETLEILRGGDVTFTVRAALDDDRHLIIYPGGKVTFEQRLDFNRGAKLTMYGGEFYSLVDTKFPDNATGVPVSIWLYGGYMKHAKMQSMRDRLSTLYIGGGIFDVGEATGGNDGDPSNSDEWDIQAIDGYGPVIITELGDGWKRITAEDPFGPDPSDWNEFVQTSTQTTLSWTNPDPNSPGGSISCDVYLGNDPNKPGMDMVTLDAGESSVELNATNFPKALSGGALANNTWYYWIVDFRDSSMDPPDDLILGPMWRFYTNDNEAPVVDAGGDDFVSLEEGDVVYTLKGVVSDDGQPNPPAATEVVWTQVANGAPEVTISSDNTAETTVTFTERGAYEFKLTADDGDRVTPDTVVIGVGDDSCDASHITGIPYDTADQNQDCIVDLEDFAALFVTSWLNCTDVVAGCDD